MSVSSPVTEWELEYRPGKLRLYAVIAAVVVLAIHIVFGALLTISDTGVRNVGALDQLSIMLIGCVGDATEPGPMVGLKLAASGG